MFIPVNVSCLSEETLSRLVAGQLMPNELSVCEEHVSCCERCRDLLESETMDATWHEQYLPAFRLVDDGCKSALHSDSVYRTALGLLGPTDDPHMLGKIANYEILALVGSGGMGVVFKAFDAALNRFVAIKMMQPHLAVSGASRQRFEREGRAAAAVINECVLPIFAVSEWRGVPYLVMQYSAGMNLQKRIDTEGPLQLTEILRIGLQVARGLAAAHVLGLVHRDVKPSNILLDGGVERAMLTDFGLARAVDDATVTRTGLIAGTPQYMSPEQVRGEKVDARSDLFSLGATLYAMCTGHSPFLAESSYATLRKITDFTPRSIRTCNVDIPEWLEILIMRLLEKGRNDRIPTAQKLVVLLEKCLAHCENPLLFAIPDECRCRSKPFRNLSKLFEKAMTMLNKHKYRFAVIGISIIVLATVASAWAARDRGWESRWKDEVRIETPIGSNKNTVMKWLAAKVKHHPHVDVKCEDSLGGIAITTLAKIPDGAAQSYVRVEVFREDAIASTRDHMRIYYFFDENENLIAPYFLPFHEVVRYEKVHLGN